jgi:SagB-type dehydrogenase family enzyme
MAAPERTQSERQDERDVRFSIHYAEFLGWTEDGRPLADDPAETYHEASKLSGGSPLAPGAALPDDDPRVQESFARSVKRHAHLPSIELPPPEFPDVPIGEAIRRRRSNRDFGTDPIPLASLSTLLHAAYGVTGHSNLEGQRFRTVPSGGGLYPLEIYPVVRNVEGVEPGLYHYDPLRHVLEQIRAEEVDERLRDVLFVPSWLPDIGGTCGVALFMLGVFWRTRFKYALRGFRFTLIEAGHVGQNVLLTAGTLGLAGFSNGGYWDHRVDDYLGADGVNESVVYSVILGTPDAEPA